MTQSANLFVAVGGVFLVTWYGLSRARNRHCERPSLPIEHDSLHYRCAATVALAAEFRDSEDDFDLLPGGSVACPECATRFPAGVLYCDCGAMTQEMEDVDDSSESPAAEDTELVCVHVAETSWKATLLKSFLESHDIPCAMSRSGSNGRQDFHNPLFGETRLWEIKLLVPCEDADRARILLSDCL